MRFRRTTDPEGASVAEIARELRIPIESVRVSLRRSLSRLAHDKVLAEFGEERPEIFRRGPRTNRDHARLVEATDENEEHVARELPRVNALDAISNPDVDDAAACEKIWQIYLRNSGPRNDGSSGAPGGAP